MTPEEQQWQNEQLLRDEERRQQQEQDHQTNERLRREAQQKQQQLIETQRRQDQARAEQLQQQREQEARFLKERLEREEQDKQRELEDRQRQEREEEEEQERRRRAEEESNAKAKKADKADLDAKNEADKPDPTTYRDTTTKPSVLAGLVDRTLTGKRNKAKSRQSQDKSQPVVVKTKAQTGVATPDKSNMRTLHWGIGVCILGLGSVMAFDYITKERPAHALPAPQLFTDDGTVDTDPQNDLVAVSLEESKPDSQTKGPQTPAEALPAATSDAPALSLGETLVREGGLGQELASERAIAHATETEDLRPSSVLPQPPNKPPLEESLHALEQQLQAVQENLRQQQQINSRLEQALQVATAADAAAAAAAAASAATPTMDAASAATEPNATPRQSAPSVKALPPAVQSPTSIATAQTRAKGRSPSSPAASGVAPKQKSSTQTAQQNAQAKPDVKLLAVDMWGGSPSVVVATTDASLGRRVLRVGDVSNGVTLQSANPITQEATFVVNGKSVTLKQGQ